MCPASANVPYTASQPCEENDGMPVPEEVGRLFKDQFLAAVASLRAAVYHVQSIGWRKHCRL